MFITLEGPEGGGKTTLIRRLAEYLGPQLALTGLHASEAPFQEAAQKLTAGNREVVTTREPGSGEFGGDVRRLLLHGGDLDPKAELFLFLADRSEHVAHVIQPALARGAVVLCDRFADSTVVYQGYGRGMDPEWLRQLNDFATGGLKPDLTLLLDLEPELGIARITAKDRLDSEGLAFHRRVREGFLAEAALDPARYCVLDASLAPETVFAKACDRILQMV